MFSRSFFLLLCLCCACISAELCRSVDVRLQAKQFDKLKNCTKINGYLKIVRFGREGVDFPSFPLLREVTEYVMIFAVHYLHDLGALFPNLVVIRGQKRFMGHALIIHHNNHLKKIALPNLREIQRGDVYVGKCPELCFVKTVNWTALGTSLSSYADVPECKDKEKCDPECEGHCWAPRKCQKIFDNCHTECLGCEKPNSAKDCLACKNWRDGDTCVSKCPPDNFLSESSMTCVTREECHNFKYTLNMTGWVFDKWCLRENTCPENYELVYFPEKTCRLCEGPCYKQCNGTSNDTSIQNKQEMRKFKGCTHITGHLEIRVKHEYEVDYLEENLLNITRIDGCLKIARAAVTSLNFLRNLKRIGGLKKDKLCNNHTVYVYENVNLKTLIEVDKIESEADVSIGFHNNPELCLYQIEKFANTLGMSHENFELILQQEKDVSPYSNGYRATCLKIRLNVSMLESYPTNVTLQWEPYNLNKATVIAYTFFYILNETLQQENNLNYDNNMCNDNGWRSHLISINTLSIKDLLPFSIYAYWIKVYYIENNRAVSGSTDMKYFETIPDDPTPPIEFEVQARSPTSVVITWESPEFTNGNLSHYKLSASIEEDDVKFMEERNYCIHPHVADKVEKPTIRSVRTWVNETANGSCKCSPFIFNNDTFCEPRRGQQSYYSKACNSYMYQLIDQPTNTRSKRYLLESKANGFRQNDTIIEIPANNTRYILKNLKPFSKYIFWFSACNVEFGGRPLCSAVLFSSTRTLANTSADQITHLNVKIFPDNTISVTWHDPESPNGMIVAYNIEYTITDSSKSLNVPDCITKRQHIESGFVYRIETLEPGIYTLRVKPISLHGAGIYSEQVTFQISTPLKTWVIYLVICIIFAITSIILYIWYIKNKRKLDRVYLIPSINPDYSRAVYIEEGWELERNDVEMNEVLGHGSFGVVYSGFIKSKNIPCAVKTVNSAAEAGYRTEFLKEAFVMKSFNDAHHVIKLYGVVSKDDPPLVIMELMERGDLKDYLRNARKNPKVISLPEMYQMAAQIADGMSYLSAKKFVHRDLAARNCMVASDRTVKIGDFGMTKDIYETDYYRKGTNGLLPVRWMAPESLADGVFSSESDVWSYGIVLWEMVTLAEHPYQGMSNEQVLKFVTTKGRLGRPRDCPNVLWEIMEACWQQVSSRRPLFVGIVEKLEPLAGQSFPLVSFYHSQAGHNYRMNYGRQESAEIADNDYAQQNSFLREEDGSSLLDDNYDHDDDDDNENYTSHPRNRKAPIANTAPLSWQSSYPISNETP